MPRKRIFLGLLATLLLAYAVSSMRRLGSAERLYVIDSPLPGSLPRRVEPGWHFVPRLLARVSEYPAGPVKLRVDLTGDRAARSREGARIEVEADLTYAVPADRVRDLHRSRGPRFEAAWLADLLRRETARRCAAVSYDVVRNRDPELAEALRIYQVAGAGESSGSIRRAAVEPVRRQVVVIGVDSFDWRIIDPLIRRGKMPRLARLAARGVRANLRTIRPILSPVIWTSIATGVKPSRHGIADFVVAAPDTGALVPVTSTLRQVPALWTLLSRQGIDVSVVGWWATWPAETVRGSMVTDRVAFQLFEDSTKEDWKSREPEKSRGKTFPPALFDEVRPLIRVPADVTDEEVAWFLPGGRIPPALTAPERELLNRFKTVLAAGQTYQAIALERFRRPGGSLKMVYYEGPDTTSHLFMGYRPPLLPGVERADSELFGGIVDRYYERQDRLIGEVLDAVGDDATVFLVSTS